MSFISYSLKEMNFKIIYYGPGLSGKTTNLKYINETSNKDSLGEFISVKDKEQRTLFFDFLPIDLGMINGFKTRLHLYTVPGQLVYESSRKLLLKGVDGIVFVADSQKIRQKANKDSLDKLTEHLNDYGQNIEDIPVVFQYNKQDVKNILQKEELSQELNLFNKQEFCTTAINGEGVRETLNAVSKLILNKLKGNI